MNKRIKKEWLAALRSGEYKQGVMMLCVGTKGRATFCCLGVLYDSCIDGTWENDGACWYWKIGGTEFSGLLPSYVLQEVGMTEQEQLKLSLMNDKGQSFARIADWIEKHL